MHYVSSYFSWTFPTWHYRKVTGEMLCPHDLKVKNKHQTKLGGNNWKDFDLAKLWKHNYPGTCDSPNKMFSHRRDLLLSNTASAALSLTNLHTYNAHRTRVQGRPEHMRETLWKISPHLGRVDSDGLAAAQRRAALWVSLLFQWMQGADVLKCGALQSSDPAAQHMGQGYSLIYRV